MRSRNRRELAQRARRALCLESLEPRQMMAADFVGPILSDPASAIDMSQPLSVGTAAAIDSPPDSNPSGPASITAPTTDRSFDGTGNNLSNPEWGSTHERLLRRGPAEYGNGISTIGGVGRPSPRHISNMLAAQQPDAPLSERGLSAFIYIWGQFLDHDIDLTGTGGASGESVPVSVPQGDPLFDPNGTGTQAIPFTRSVFDPTTGTSTANPRQQINQITAWIDGSMVYGSDQATADSLRTFQGGALRTSAGNLPPENSAGFVAGDSRANENIELTSLHALFIREHNRLAGEMALANPTWTDERIYQEARALVAAKIQVITFKEFLPALLGSQALESYQGYDPTVNPGIANEFSTAAYRLHTMVNDDVKFLGNDGRAVRNAIELREAFHNPALLKLTGIDSILKYAASSQAQEIDNRIVNGLRNFLFGSPGQGGLDLASLNIQRGRDHGLADYNAVRQAYGLAAVSNFSQITSNQQLAQTLGQVYGNVDNIDLWVGIMAEDHAPGSSIGALGQAIISDQFERIRDGDRYWYQNIFSGSPLEYLERTTLADVIQRNTTVNNLQSNVFFMQAEITGQVFADTNGDGRQDQLEGPLPVITVELLNGAGKVIASSRTDGNGRYRLNVTETGDFRVRVVLPPRKTTITTTRDVLVSRGDLTMPGVDFGLQTVATFPRPQFAPSGRQAAQAASLASIDAVFEVAGLR
jgi:peroxidase